MKILSHKVFHKTGQEAESFVFFQFLEKNKAYFLF